MTTILRRLTSKNSGVNDAIIDKLRSCNTVNEILEFENWFNSQANSGPLHTIICNLLKDRSISRSTASKWFEALLEDRDKKINNMDN